MSEEARRTAINRAKKNMTKVPQPAPPEMVEQEVPYVFVAEENASQFSGTSLEQGKDIVLYAKIHMFRPEALKNIDASGKSVLEVAQGKKGVFIVCHEADAGDIVKLLIEDSIKGDS